MSTDSFVERRDRLLKAHQLDLTEWIGMTCPSYCDYMPINEMASWTVIENSHLHFSADDYLDAIRRLINRGLLAIFDPAQVEEIRTQLISSGAPFCPSEVPTAGCPAFTKLGWRVHRRILRTLFPDRWSSDADTLSIREEQDYVTRVYALNHETLSARVKIDSEHPDAPPGWMVARVCPGPSERSGPWWTSRFLKHHHGLMVRIQFEFMPCWTVFHKDPSFEYSVRRINPFFAIGKADEFRFTFGESLDTLGDGTRRYQWYFKVSCQTRILTP